MGLMLSVLVFCVGVAEVLDCWHHFLLHLVQPQYNPLPRNVDLKTDYLNDRELPIALSESRRTSNVDICWPKDLSPDDDLHVIKKRPHSEVPRGGEHDGDALHRVTRKPFHHEKDITSHALSSESAESPTPDIVLHSPDPTDFFPSPSISRETSPNRLELGVIVESDSSSEVDEPSLIENLNYRKGNPSDFIEQEEELSELCRDGTLLMSDTSARGIPRPKCPSAMILEEEGEGELIHTTSDVGKSNESKTTSLPELPVFTDNILSRDVHRVDVHYPATTETSNEVPLSCDIKYNADKNIDYLENLKIDKSDPFEKISENNMQSKVLPISSILDEGLEPIPEFPEIKILESSPVPQEDESESSLNTSDASWMVRSKTSDRPLVIRFDMSLEKVKQDFQSVVQTDLRALGDKEREDNKATSCRSLVKADSVDVYYDALVNQIGGEGKVLSPSDLEENISRPDCDNGVGINELDVKPQSINFMQIDSNSSSSSLSGISPLPEDMLESFNQTVLATDNGFSQTTDMVSSEISFSQSDKPAISFLTSNTRDKRESSQQKLVETENFKSEENVVSDEKIFPAYPSAILSINDVKMEKEHNPSVSEQNVITKDQHFSDIVKDKEVALDVLPETFDSKLKDIAEPPSLSTKSENCKAISPHQENVASVKETDTTSNKNDAVVTQERRSQVSKTFNKITQKGVPVNPSEEDSSKIPAKCDQPCPSTSKTASHTTTSKEDNPHIPTHPQGNVKTFEAQKETLPLDKANSSKKQKAKYSSKNSSTDSSDMVVLCHAKKSDEEIRAENRAESATVKTDTANDSNSPKSEQPAKAGPSKTNDEARPSTSKNEGDKAFWLIFSGEYTKAMNKDWHSGHFCCWQCDESLTGQRYVLRDEHPYCVKCYESVFANGCEECSKTIGIDSKDLSYKDKHWHEACFLCNKCRVSLVDKQFGSKLDKIFCGNCYDQQFASRCDGCGQIFKAGTKKMEYKTRQWHEPCFSCCVCKSPIGTKSFIPREQEIYCATCYEEKFATRCVKCNKIITSGGVTYKNEPWHRECFTCTHCNTSLAGQRFTSRDEKPYCAECFGELFAKRCTACSKPITGIGGTRFISFEDRHWHNDCFICASCKTSLVGRGFITDGDDIICPECAKQKLM